MIELKRDWIIVFSPLIIFFVVCIGFLGLDNFGYLIVFNALLLSVAMCFWIRQMYVWIYAYRDYTKNLEAQIRILEPFNDIEGR